SSRPSTEPSALTSKRDGRPLRRRARISAFMVGAAISTGAAGAAAFAPGLGLAGGALAGAGFAAAAGLSAAGLSAAGLSAAGLSAAGLSAAGVLGAGLSPG